MGMTWRPRQDSNLRPRDCKIVVRDGRAEPVSEMPRRLLVEVASVQFVSYDRLAESVRLIETGLTSDPVRLSRRRRFAAVAYEVQNDVAAAWFVRRGHNTFWHEIHTLARRGGVWSCLGGGGHNADEDGLADRPCAAELGGRLVSRGGGSTGVGQRSLLPLPDRFVTYAELLVAEEVSAVEVGSDHRAAPRHGRLLAVWTERPPRVRALAADGDELATLDLASGRTAPKRVLLSRRRPGRRAG